MNHGEVPLHAGQGVKQQVGTKHGGVRVDAQHHQHVQIGVKADEGDGEAEDVDQLHEDQVVGDEVRVTRPPARTLLSPLFAAQAEGDHAHGEDYSQVDGSADVDDVRANV